MPRALVVGAIAAACFAPQAWAAGVTPQSADGHWSFESQSAGGGYANDGVTQDLAIQVDGTGVKAEKSDVAALGTSLAFADKTQDFNVRVPKAVDSQGTYTISAWVKSTDDAPAQKTAVLQFAGEGRTLLYQRDNGEFVSFLAGPSGDGGGGDISLGTDPARGAWEHITVVKSGDPKSIKLYVNGTKLKDGTWTGNLPAGMMDLIFGEHKNPNDMARFEGMMDELCVFRRALTDAEVKELYSSYGDITVADDLGKLIDEATDLYDSMADMHESDVCRELKAAIDQAKQAFADGELQPMKDARDALKKAVQAVRDLGPTIAIDTGAIKRSISSSLFGINHRYSNFGYGTVNPDGTVKSDFAELYQQAGFGSLRYPGGTISNNYVWTESIGDLDPNTKEIERTPQIHGFYNNAGQAGFAPTFGLLEVAEFAEQMDSEIIMVYGIGRGDAADAADLVEFLNAEQGANPNGGVAWADKRAELGHPEPFGIRYFEIGNENNQGGDDGTASQQYWMTGVAGGALEGYVDGGLASFTGQYAVIRGDWNAAKSKSTGAKNQEFACRYALIPREMKDGSKRDAVVPGSVKVYVGGEQWTAVDDITKAGPTDKVYQLDMTSGFFTFGDGVHGAIPEQGKQITVDYQVQRDGFIDISRAMRETMDQIDPDWEQSDALNIYTSWEGDNFVDAMHTKGADDLYEGMAVHPYTNKVGNPAYNDNAPTEANKQSWYLDVMRLGDGVADTVQHHVDYMRKVTGDDTKVPVISEYGIFRSTNPMVRSQAHALYIARAIMEYAEQGSPYIQKHCLVDYYSSGADSLGPTQQAVIQAVAQGNLDDQKDGTGEFKFFSTPSAHIFSMLNSTFGDTEVTASIANETMLSNGVAQHSVMASTDADGNIYVALVNLALNDVQGAGADAELPSRVTLAIDGVDLNGRELEIKSLSGDSFYAENSLDDPEHVAVETRSEVATSAAHALELDPHSFTIVKIKAADAPKPPVDPDPDPEPAPTHTVIFVVDGATYHTATVADGDVVAEPARPTKQGYAFVGWLNAEGAAYDFSVPVTGDVVLTAAWKKAETPTPPGEEGQQNPGKPGGDGPSGTKPGATDPQGDLPQTGDVSLALAAASSVAAAASLMIARRQRASRR